MMTMNRLINNSQQKRKDPSLLELCDAIKDIKTTENKKYSNISQFVKDNAFVKNGILLHSEIKESENSVEDNLQPQKLNSHSNLSYSWDYPKQIIDEEINARLIDKMLESANNTNISQLSKNINPLGTPSKKYRPNNSLFAPPKNDKSKKFPLLFQKRKFDILLKSQKKEKDSKKIVKRSKSLNDKKENDDYFQKNFPITADSLLKSRVIVSPLLTLNINNPNKKSKDPIGPAQSIKIGKRVLTPIKIKYSSPIEITKKRVSNVEIIEKKYFNNSFVVKQKKNLNVWEIFESFLNQTQPITPTCTPNFPIGVQR